VVDLMTALKASLEARKGGEKAKASRPSEARPRRKAS
jgi:non-homologous end joining protein Ku